MVGSVEECKQACSDHPTCESVVYVRDEAENCQLHAHTLSSPPLTSEYALCVACTYYSLQRFENGELFFVVIV